MCLAGRCISSSCGITHLITKKLCVIRAKDLCIRLRLGPTGATQSGSCIDRKEIFQPLRRTTASRAQCTILKRRAVLYHRTGNTSRYSGSAGELLTSQEVTAPPHVGPSRTVKRGATVSAVPQYRALHSRSSWRFIGRNARRCVRTHTARINSPWSPQGTSELSGGPAETST